MNSVAVSTRRDDLVRAFLDTEYVVSAGGEPYIIRIGRTHPRIDRRIGNQPWAIVTAYNPGAVDRSEVDNRRRHASLVRMAESTGLRTIEACNRDPSGQWPDEPGLLLYPCAGDMAKELALEFGQVGFVAGRAGTPAELWLIGNGWPARLPEHCLQVAA